jgi:transposase-like protein
LVLTEKKPLTEAATDLGISVGTLNGWIGKFRSGVWNIKTGGPRDGGSGQSASHSAAEQQRILDLERQVRLLKIEREILKKAMAYCIEVPK